eukprot:CAMPEP_0177314942 /NCGR_PEP_ID=MMETSP0368-20130122/12191_1 /TAXON_ID=447022 ORGANISM="Scrippsiella hangoei-like, Strain SHHI-4" /NCGR_SAMPLE_ID=MMETSP0368 /ASSEMBLY_ACC=CAM_ASM_000363 /LENGTH=432 /DNA_ID=CAMNT_0018774101 /DNA_START=1 /DNA_END=1299 /DNA_ORIENTATION=-
MSQATHVKNFRLNLLAVLPGQMCDDGKLTNSESIMKLDGSELLKLVAQLSARSGVIWVTSILATRLSDGAPVFLDALEELGPSQVPTALEAQLLSAPASGGSPGKPGSENVPVELDTGKARMKREDLSVLQTISHHNLLTKANDELAAMLKSCGIRGFSQVLCSSNFQLSLLNAIQISGLGPVKPNCTLVHYPSNCLDNSPDGIQARSNLVCSIQSGVVCDKSVLVAMGESWPSAGDRLQTSIDIWWFAASFAGDGGMLLLIPQLLRWHPVWRRCKVRVFVVNDTNDVADTTMADTIDAYLKDVRIPGEVTTVPLVTNLGDASDLTEIVVDQAQFTRQVSLGGIQRSLNNWINLDVAGAESCSNDVMEAAQALNSAFLLESANADVVLTNLPDLLDKQSALGYCQVLEQIARGLKRVILVHEDTLKVITQDN